MLGQPRSRSVIKIRGVGGINTTPGSATTARAARDRPTP